MLDYDFSWSSGIFGPLDGLLLKKKLYIVKYYVYVSYLIGNLTVSSLTGNAQVS